MAKRQRKNTSSHGSDNITIGNISGGTGFAIGTKAKAVVTQNTDKNLDQIGKAFEAILQVVQAMPEGTEKNVAENAVQALQEEAHKGDRADEGKIQKWVKFLSETAPDAWEVAVNTFANPISGISTVFKKIADKAKAEREAGQAKPT
jgi:hypothetical protein